MKFSGEEEFAMQPSELWRKLIDVPFVARHLPGVKAFELSEPRRAVCKVRPGFSFLSAPLKLTVEIVQEREAADEQPSHTARMQVRGEGIAASLLVETNLELFGTNNGTKLVWTGEVTQMSGLLKTISRGLLEGAAKKVIADGWANIRRELESV